MKMPRDFEKHCTMEEFLLAIDSVFLLQVRFYVKMCENVFFFIFGDTHMLISFLTKLVTFAIS